MASFLSPRELVKRGALPLLQLLSPRQNQVWVLDGGGVDQ